MSPPDYMLTYNIAYRLVLFIKSVSLWKLSDCSIEEKLTDGRSWHYSHMIDIQ